MTVYTVRPGDSLYGIARRFGVPWSRIASANALTNPNRLAVGQNLVIPSGTVRHTVMKGETLYDLAKQYGVSLKSIIDANPNIENPDLLQVGQIVIVPGSEKLGSIDVNGYAFPTTSAQTLANTVPYLTYISMFSYDVRPDGTLSPLDDTRIIDTAQSMNTAALMVVSNIREGGSFDSELASVVLNDEGTKQALWSNILEIMKEKDFYGLNLDFEYVYPRDRDAYNAFVQQTAELMHENGYILVTNLAPKLSGEQQGTLYEAHDYGFHGQFADLVILMTYEWGYTYGPARAVAPIDQVERVLEYAVSVMPSKKILMGMPNYGYDWTLPFVRGSAARALSNQAAVELALEVGAEIRYDERAQSPYFNYTDKSGKQHVVYFDDARSILARLALVSEYNLAGVSYWNINTFFRPNWEVLSSMYDINKVI